MLERLSRLSLVAAKRRPSIGDVEAACELIKDALRAADVYVVRGGDPHFIRLGSDLPADAYEIKQRGYWMVWRDLASDEERPFVEFSVRERLVGGIRPLSAGSQHTHVACILPGDESNSEMLVVHGPWPKGLAVDESTFLAAVRPMMAYLVSNVVDSERQVRQQEQLKALAGVARAFSEAQEVDNVLEAVATAIAKATGIDWVTISLVNEDCTEVIERAANVSRYSNTEAAELSLRMETGERVLEVAQALGRRRVPFLYPDVFDPKSPMSPELRAFHERAHILSIAVFPLIFQDKLLGSISFSSSTKRDFGPAEVSFLEDVTSQAATTIKGLTLYRELDEASRIGHFLARTDALTGIPNRRYIEEVLRAECVRAHRSVEPVSVVMADLDHFKRINDTFGHDVGDEALKHVASLARRTCGEWDFVGRWGGDEFVFILPVTPLERGMAFADRFRTLLSGSRFVPSGANSIWPITVSAGVAQAGEEAHSRPETLLKFADSAMYAAKESGRNRVMASGPRAAAA